MEIDRAKELLTVLADGINPITGELLSDEDSCNQVEIVRALHAVIMELERKPEKQKMLNTQTPASLGRKKRMNS